MPASPTRVYLAGPLGFSELGRLGLAKLADLLGQSGYVVVDPFALTPQEDIDRVSRLPSLEAQRDAWRTLSLEIGRANREAIDACDLIVAVLDGPDVDSGAAAEIGYAFARGKRIVGYRGDFRLAADNIGSTVNLQVEYFIRASGGEIASSLSELMSALHVHGGG
ncbi:MAG: nucleoside 2-deoxyribosyltransferase [Hyphomicrobiales bacterium]|nr:nucleoside 2-deoxyribosyltransferase [Hyphomicrobiales bacterium]